MAKHERRRAVKKGPREPFPWLPFLLLVATLGLFWVLPHQLGSPAVRVDFAAAKGKNQP